MKTLALFPPSTHLDEKGQLWLGGCPASSLAREFGTPLYVFDEATLRARCREYRQALAQHYPSTGQVAYASKAYLNLALAQLFAQEGLGLDVVSGGELYVARQADFPAERIHFHGNNKTPAELAVALDEGVGRIVVDNFHELDELERLAAERRVRAHYGCASRRALTSIPTAIAKPACSIQSSASRWKRTPPSAPWSAPWPVPIWNSSACTPTSAPRSSTLSPSPRPSPSWWTSRRR